jgi:hypothetical protein
MPIVFHTKFYGFDSSTFIIPVFAGELPATDRKKVKKFIQGNVFGAILALVDVYENQIGLSGISCRVKPGGSVMI